MITFLSMLYNVLLLVFLAVPGYILGKMGKVEDDALVSVSNVLTYVAMPFLVFLKLLQTDLGQIKMSEIAICVLLPIGLILILYAISSVMFCKGEDRFPVSRFCAVFSNCGFLGIPLAEAIFPQNSEVAVYVSLFNVSSTFLLLTLGRFMLSREKKEISLGKAVICPVLIALVLGGACSLLGLSTHVPQVATYAGHLASLTTPLSMIVLGFELSKLNALKLFAQGEVYRVGLVKLLISPLLTVGLLWLLGLAIPISPYLAAAMFLSTAVSTAASAPAMAKQYGRDAEYAASLTLGNTLLCVVSLPLLYLLFDLLF